MRTIRFIILAGIVAIFAVILANKYKDILNSTVDEYDPYAQREKVSDKKLNYSESDIEEHTDKYIKNKYELECAEWEQLVEQFNAFI